MGIVAKESIARNGKIVSLLYNGVQLDFIIESDPEIYKFSVGYYAWGDLGNLVGKVARAYKMKFGHDGLFYTHKKPGYRKDYLLTRNFDEALEFMGLDCRSYANGFVDAPDVIRFVSTSFLFHRSHHTTRHLTNKDRVRDMKRPMFRDWMEFCQQNPILEYDQVETPPMPFSVFRHSILEKAHPWLFPLIEQDEQLQAKSQKARSMILEKIHLLPWQGKDLGVFMRYLQSRLGPTKEEMSDWVLANSAHLESVLLRESGIFQTLNQCWKERND